MPSVRTLRVGRHSRTSTAGAGYREGPPHGPRRSIDVPFSRAQVAAHPDVAQSFTSAQCPAAMRTPPPRVRRLLSARCMLKTSSPLSELRVALLDPPREPDPRTNGFSARYELLTRFLAEECGDLLVVLLDSYQSEVDRRARNLPLGVTSIPLLLQAGSESRARRLSKATMSLSQIPSRPAWDRRLEMQARAWAPDVVVAPILPYYPPAYRQYVRPLMRSAPTILFLEEDGLPYGFAAESPQAKALRRLELWAERRVVRTPPAAVVVISERERGWAQGIYPRSPVRVIPHGLDDDYWDVAQAHDPAAGTSRDVFTICRLGSERSAEGIVQISRALARREADSVARSPFGRGELRQTSPSIFAGSSRRHRLPRPDRRPAPLLPVGGRDPRAKFRRLRREDHHPAGLGHKMPGRDNHKRRRFG